MPHSALHTATSTLGASWFSSGTRAYATPSTDAKKRASFKVWSRLLANLTAYISVSFSLSTSFVAIGAGALNRRLLFYSAANDVYRPLSQTCRLTSSGFAPNSCSRDEWSLLATPAAWIATGNQLAHLLDVPPASTLYVTTCVVGCNDKSSASVQLLMGYNSYPECNPKHGGQPIAGLVLLEGATVDEVYPQGAYLLTVFADASMNQTTMFVDSDDIETRVVDDVARVLVGVDGSSQSYADGANAILRSTPLGAHYGIEASCTAQIVDVSTKVQGQPGWCYGEYSKIAVVTGKACGHSVANALEIELLHLILVAVTLIGCSADIITTLQGVRGVLQHKPVLTYDFISSLERRRGLLGIGVATAYPAAIFIDVGRLYDASSTYGEVVWFCAVVVVAMLFAWGILWLSFFVSSIPSPRALLRYRLVPSSASVLLYAGLLALFFDLLPRHDTMYKDMLASVSNILTLHLDGQDCACGAYATAAIPPAINGVLPAIFGWLAVCYIASVVYGVCKLRFFSDKWLLDANWTKDNVFIKVCGAPHWTTTLPFDAADTVRIGHRLFCKPSMVARLGFVALAAKPATRRVLTEAAAKNDDDGVLCLVSVYDFLAALLPPRWRPYAPKILGQIKSNDIQPPSSCRLAPSKQFTFTRGSCVG
ncbi:hypothetical protein SDRG_00767 [Saprolegnia diclina VS20]|uniref:Transmembrane protein n=1 Tax=Saprolegnia diclina (strain VS20) TaxID=1156394 RepID=T0SFU9_SAPDV|nr:hypothetical protein SDRG_00767 [Saprolegnia diclina VS20]EQC41912.1 hypothetical protein SDRG_00767 [Saprolegnia diclina VS20]|eukprot:XP_008604481.1 hypothetical protein SDRG_00767 [Saprolegnia diclina VS20]